MLHGAKSDVEWLQRDFGIVILNLFDTFEAARVLGLPSKGLGSLLQKYCQVQVSPASRACSPGLLAAHCSFWRRARDTMCRIPEVQMPDLAQRLLMPRQADRAWGGAQTDKRYQLADWRIRPLPREMQHYARLDTHYLLYIHDCMKVGARPARKAAPTPGTAPAMLREAVHSRQTGCESQGPHCLSSHPSSVLPQLCIVAHAAAAPLQYDTSSLWSVAWEVPCSRSHKAHSCTPSSHCRG